MKKSDLGQTIAILANVAVLVGIAFVGYELRQANRIARGTTSYELSRNWMTVNDLILTNPDVLDLVVALRDEAFEPGSNRVSEQAAAYARRLLANWISIQEAYDNGLVSKNLYEVALADVSQIVTNRPGLVGEYADMPSAYLNYDVMEPIVAALEGRRGQ